MTDTGLSDQERRTLLHLARSTICRAVGVQEIPSEPKDEGRPELNAGAFVSLHKKGTLRGCIGTFDTTQPILNQVEAMAKAAATRDPRFSPVTAEEVADLDIEISVLSPPHPIADVNEIEIGKHGIVVSRGYQRGVLLPQVATEYGWDRETFLRHTCRKAGLHEEAWQEQETIIEVFSAEVFGEQEK